MDTTATTMVATGKVMPVNVYDPNAPRGAAKVQERGPEGQLLWVADFLVDDEDADRAALAGVKIEAPQQPVFNKLQPVRFNWLTVSVYVDGAGHLGLSYTGGVAAAGSASTGSAPASKAA